jgi:protein involved in sex pheromone biosynthesis
MRSVLAVVRARTCFGTDQRLYRAVRFVSDSESLNSWLPVKARKRPHGRQPGNYPEAGIWETQVSLRYLGQIHSQFDPYFHDLK